MFDIAPVTKEAIEFKARAESFNITSDFEFGIANEDLKNVKARLKSVEAQRVSVTKPINDSLKRVNDMFRGPITFLKEAEAALKTAILTYQKKIAEEQEKAAAEAAKALEATKAELAKQAEQLESSGDIIAAQVIRDQSETLAPAKAQPIESCLSTYVTKDVEVTDLKAFLQGIIDGTIPTETISINMPVIRKAYKSGTLFQGCTEVQKERSAVR